MKRPPFKVDNRIGVLVWCDAEGQKRVQSGRVGFLYGRVFAQAVIAGTGSDFKIRLASSGWHVIEATPEEVKAEMRRGAAKGNLPQATEGLIARAERIRDARVAAGKSVV